MMIGWKQLENVRKDVCFLYKIYRATRVIHSYFNCFKMRVIISQKITCKSRRVMLR